MYKATSSSNYWAQLKIRDMKQCVLMQHGLSIVGTRIGTCCFNTQNPKVYKNLDIDETFCRACIDQERNGIHSYREGVNQKYGLDHDHQSPIVLEVVPNINCNLACRNCSEKRSSTWAKHKQVKITRDDNTSVDEFLNLLSEFDLSRVKEINFSGGEPWLNNAIIKYLQPLSAQVDFSKIILRFSTNGTHQLTDKLEKFFLQFELVQPQFSLDDIGAGHEYQRWPSIWSEWENNWKDFLERMPHNVMPVINRTVGILNVHRLHHLENWLKDYQFTRFGDPIQLRNHFALNEYSLDNITPGLKNLASIAPSPRSQEYVKNRSGSVDQLLMLQQHILLQDRIHGTDLKTADPDLYQAIFL
jgi:hypothetical protein